MKQGHSKGEAPPLLPFFPTKRDPARNVATKRPAACEGAPHHCNKRQKGMRGWRVTALSPSAGQLKTELLCPAAPLAGRGNPRNPASKRTAEVSSHQPKRLKKASDQRVSVVHRAAGEREISPSGFKMTVAQRHPAVKRRASPSPEPCLLKKQKNRGEEGNTHVKPQLDVNEQHRQSPTTALKAPRPHKIPSVLNKPPQHVPKNKGSENDANNKGPKHAPKNKCAKQATKDNIPERPRLQGSVSAEERARRYLAHLGVRLLKEKTVRRMITFGSHSLGEGSYGSCCKGVDPHAGKEVVVKTFLKDALRSLVTEAKCLQRLQGHGMQRMVGVCVETRQLVTRFAGQTAADYFHSGACFTHALSVILQVARAVRSVNEAGYTHNDIKNNNVCVKQSTSGPKATLIDLGLAKRVGTRGFYKTHEDITAKQRQFPWIAPELLRDSHPCSAASDVFSVAWFILRVPGWQDRPVASPAMWLFKEWVRKARRPLPEQRPSLDELMHVVKQLHTDMASRKPSCCCR